MAATTVRLRGEGSAVWEFDLPLSELFTEQVVGRKLVPVDEDEHAKIADLLVTDAAEQPLELPPEPEQENEPASGETVTEGDQTPVDVDELKKLKLLELVEYAGTVGVDEATVASFSKPGTSKAKVIDAIVAATATT